MIFSGFLGLFGSCLNSNDVLCLVYLHTLQLNYLILINFQFSVGLVTIIIVQLGTGITCLCYHVKASFFVGDELLQLWDNLHLSMKKAVESYHFNKTISTIMDKIHRDVIIISSLFDYSLNVVVHLITQNMEIKFPRPVMKMVPFTKMYCQNNMFLHYYCLLVCFHEYISACTFPQQIWLLYKSLIKQLAWWYYWLTNSLSLVFY